MPYRVEKCLYQQSRGEPLEGYILEHTSLYPYLPNKYLHRYATRSPQTCKQYAYKLCRFLNFLEENYNVGYQDATMVHLNRFLSSLAFKTDGKIISISEGEVNGPTLERYVGVIKSFYIFLKSQDIGFSVELRETVKSKNSHSYLYGQVWSEIKINFLIDTVMKRKTVHKEYIKWYTNEQQTAIFAAFNTVRDKAIFSLTLDGLRIDEAISLRFSKYDLSDGTYELYRSKGQQTGEVERIAILSDRTIRYLEDYVFNERASVEDDFLNNDRVLTDSLFINLKNRSGEYGQPVKYHNWLGILKTAAKNAGLDPKKIRTHSGRSTRAGELYLIQAKDPKTLTDNQIKDILGWKSDNSAKPYKNRNDRDIAKENLKRLQEVRRAIDEKHSGADTDS